MDPDPPLDLEFTSQLDRMLDGQLTAEDLPRVNDILRTSAAARRQYRSYLALHAMMTWEGLEQATAASLQGLDGSSGKPQDCEAATQRKPTAAGTSMVLGFLGQMTELVQRSPQVTLLVLTVLLVGYFLTVMALVPLARWAQSTHEPQAARLQARVDPQSNHLPAAWLAGVRGCRWKASAPVFGASVERQSLEVAEGIVELTFANAVRVVIEGPARFEVESIGRLWLDRGKLAAVVPQSGAGFTVATPSAEVIDLGTEFGVEVDEAGVTDVHVLRGRVELKSGFEDDRSAAAAHGGLKLDAGQAARVSQPGKLATSIRIDRSSFADIVRVGRQGAQSPRSVRPVSEIWLGNLFDDRPHVPLADALLSDTMRATADVADLGVDRVLYGGEPIKEFAPGLRFDLKNAGWKAAGGYHLLANDAWSHATDQTKNFGIRLQGTKLEQAESKVDEGIGAHANAIVTFNLDDIRAAGSLPKQALEFVCDRAGINDLSIGGPGSVHFIVLVATPTDVTTATVDGKPTELVQADGAWSLASAAGDPILADGRFVTFKVSIGPEAKYLTLITTSAGDDSMGDAAVWIGARLQTPR